MSETIQLMIMAYLALMNLTGFTIMGVDKRKAVKKAYRIPEKRLIMIACIGGGIGSFLGMYFFRHKTKHLKFVIVLPLTAIIYAIVLLRLINILP